MEAMEPVDPCHLIIWKIGAYDGISDSFWIPQISVLSELVFICSFKRRGALTEHFVAFTQFEEGLQWIRDIEIIGC